MEKQDARDETNFREMCETFTAETKEYCGQLHQMFVKSLNHVHQTLDVLMHFSLDHKILDQETSDDPKLDLNSDGFESEPKFGSKFDSKFDSQFDGAEFCAKLDCSSCQ